MMTTSYYEDTIAFLGEWGPFQWTIFLLLSMSAIPNGHVGLSMVFLGDTPPHHCRLPEGAEEMPLNLSLPQEQVNGQVIFSRCQRYVGAPVNDTSDLQTEGCIDGWEYSKEQYSSTIVTEWDLVCQNDWKGPLSTSLFFLGVLIGSFISGQLSDRYGRKKAFFISLIMQTVFSLIQVGSNSWEMFAVLYVLVGLGQTSNFLCAFVLGSELLRKQARLAYSCCAINIGFAIGYLMVPLFGYLIRDWRMLLLALSLPGLLYAPLWWVIPESPRWLLSQGRIEEAETIIVKAAKRNRIIPPTPVFKPEDVEKYVLELSEEKDHKYTYLDIVKNFNIGIITVVTNVIWLVISMTYYGLNLNTPNLNGDPYLNCFYSAATEFVAYIVSWLILIFGYRRLSSASLLFFSGSILLLVQLIPSDLTTVINVLVLLGKLGITAVFAIVYVYSSELYPTVVRNMGVSMNAMSARTGSLISPYFAYIGSSNKILPFILMGSFSLIAGAMNFVLPETRGMPLPEKISDMQQLRCCNKCSRVATYFGSKEENQKEDIQVAIF